MITATNPARKPPHPQRTLNLDNLGALVVEAEEVDPGECRGVAGGLFPVVLPQTGGSAAVHDQHRIHVAGRHPFHLGMELRCSRQ